MSRDGSALVGLSGLLGLFIMLEIFTIMYFHDVQDGKSLVLYNFGVRVLHEVSEICYERLEIY